MCGINGFTFENHELIKKMNDLLVHRGPDSSGIYKDEKISLGHRRLKIIDLSEKASQPMFDSENKIAIIFNGEIYNFKELKKELEKDYKFKSNSDTEVIIYAYKKWGYNCVEFLNGMWAFAIYDKGKNKLFLSRDRLGKKPLYYTLLNNKLIFSSEIRPLFVHAIKKDLNKKSISSFLSYRYVLGEETMFEGIFKLLSGYNLVFDLNEDKIEKIWEYWDLEHNEININENEAKKNVDYLLTDSVSLRQVSDVPIGSINSGGLDSSLISAIMAKINDNPINTFTVKFPEKGFDETYFAKLLADYCNTIHKEIIIDTSNFLDIMKEYSKKKDEPIGVPNEIALYLLFKEIKKSVTVILSGEGADEIFAGYSRIFRSPYDYERLNKIKNIEDYKKNPSLYKKYNGKFFKNELEHFLFLYNYFPNEEKNFILKENFISDFSHLFKKYFDNNLNYQKKISYAFIKLHLPGLFARLDNSSMASAVEARCPFVDYRLVNLVYNLPFNLKNPWKSEEDKKLAENKNCDEIAEVHDHLKYILKKVSKDYIPEEIINRKKQGFPLPLQKWFKEDFYEESKNLLLSEGSRIRMVANIDNLKEWIENKGNIRDEQFGQKLWMLLSLELWLKEWF
mgnify:CR=1 FL=1